MKKISALFFVLIFATVAKAQFDKQLCKANEAIVFSFQLKNQKWVSVCKEKNGNYLVYRFGTPNNIELQYPAILDSTSWQRFTFNGYSRGGGKQNAAMHHAFLNFNNNGVNYEVYETWNSEDDKEQCGISVGAGKSTIDMHGNLKSRKGYLLDLMHEEKIKREEDN
ncbi:MAG: hypothetical protein ABI685_05330 [Ferruginibacter sp.]